MVDFKALCQTAKPVKRSIDSSQSPIFPSDRRDVTLLTVEIENCEQSKRSRDGKTVVGGGGTVGGVL